MAINQYVIDSHCHLTYPEFAELGKVIERAVTAGVGGMQTISTKRDDFARVIGVAESDPRVWASIGIHPHEAAAHQDITVEELEKWAEHPRVIGLGETGLDYYYEHSPREKQKYCFITHIEAARKTSLPLIIHTRNAEEDTANILENELARGNFSGLLHCFTSSRKLAEKALELGFYISLSGIVTFKKSTELQSLAKDIPLNRLLVETDAPYLAPEPHRGKPNEPAYTRHTAEFLAKLRGIPYENLAAATTENFFRLFKKAL